MVESMVVSGSPCRGDAESSRFMSVALVSAAWLVEAGDSEAACSRSSSQIARWIGSGSEAKWP